MKAASSNKAAYWEAHVKAYLMSPLSMKKYCRASNITYHQFQYRYNCYRKKAGNISPISSSSAPEFVTLKVNSVKPAFQITLPNGTQCAVTTPFDKEVLGQLLEVLNA